MPNETASAADGATALAPITNRQIFAAIQIMPVVMSLQLSPVASFQLAKANKKISAAWQTLNEARLALISRHAKKDAGGKNVEEEREIAPGNRQMMTVFDDPEAFASEWESVLDQAADIDNLKPIEISSLGAEVKVAPAILLALDFLFVD